MFAVLSYVGLIHSLHITAPSLDHRTKGMAEDVIALFDYLNWTEERSVHVVGISLGGMIALGNGPVIQIGC